MRIKVGTMRIAVHDELSRLAIYEGLEKSYLVWCALRQAVTAKDLDSKFNKNEVISTANDYGLQFSKRQWTRIFTEGENLFWNMSSHRLYMRSFKKVVKKLINRSPGFEDINKIATVSIDAEGLNTQALRAELYLVWFATRPERTIARATITELFNLSADQQRAYEKLLDGRLLVKSNYVHINQDWHELDAKNEQFEQLPAHATQHTERKINANRVETQNTIAYQIPNTYIVSCDSGVSPKITAKTARSTVRMLSRQSSCFGKNKRLYYRNYDDCKRNNEDGLGLWRAYYQGNKRVWKHARYS